MKRKTEQSHIKTYRNLIHFYADVLNDEKNLSEIMNFAMNAHIKERLNNSTDSINKIKMDNP